MPINNDSAEHHNDVRRLMPRVMETPMKFTISLPRGSDTVIFTTILSSTTQHGAARGNTHRQLSRTSATTATHTDATRDDTTQHGQRQHGQQRRAHCANTHRHSTPQSDDNSSKHTQRESDGATEADTRQTDGQRERTSCRL